MDDYDSGSSAHFPDPLSRKWMVQKQVQVRVPNLVHEVLKLSDSSLYQDVTLLCSDGKLKMSSFLLATVFPVFRDVLVKVSHFEEEVVISLPDIAGEKIKKFLNDLLIGEIKIVFGEALKFLLQNQPDVETVKDIELQSQGIEDAEVDFAELDPLDDYNSSDKGIQLEAPNDGLNTKVKNRVDVEDQESVEDLDERINQSFSRKHGYLSCHHCPHTIQFNSYIGLEAMKKHVEKHINAQEKKYVKCPECSRMYASKDSLRHHQRRVHNINSTKEKDTEEEIEEHMKKKDSDEEVVFDDLDPLLSEDVGENNEDNSGSSKIRKKNFQCNFAECTYRTSCSKYLKRHLKRHADGRSIPYPQGIKEDKQKCIVEDCQFMAPSIRSINLRLHLESQHSDVSPACQKCGKDFPSFKELLGHMYQHEIAVSCEICGKTVSSVNLKRHLETHSSEDSIECDKCKRFLRPNTFSKHKCFREQEPPKVVCTICGILVVNLKGHVKNVHNSDAKKVQCPICGKSFKGKLHIKIHMVSHEEKQACPICGINVRNVKDHIKAVHTEDDKKPFQCQDCGKGFIKDDQLQRHRINIHLKTYPYHCRYGCDVRYNDASNRRQHEKKKHGKLFQNEKESFS